MNYFLKIDFCGQQLKTSYESRKKHFCGLTLESLAEEFTHGALISFAGYKKFAESGSFATKEKLWQEHSSSLDHLDTTRRILLM